MSGHSVALAHESAVSKFSPYLSLSLLVLCWNLLSTIVGVGLNEGDPSTVAPVKYTLYGLSLLISPAVVFLFGKYASLWLCKIHKKMNSMEGFGI